MIHFIGISIVFKLLSLLTLMSPVFKDHSYLSDRIFRNNQEFSFNETKFNKSFCRCDGVAPKARILNGTLIGPTDMQWIVSLASRYVYAEPYDASLSQGENVDKEFQVFCTGSIINPLWVVTACHCIMTIEENNERSIRRRSKPDYELFVGAGLGHNLVKVYLNPKNFRKVVETIKHPLYKKSDKVQEHLHDIGVLKLEKPFEFGDETGIYPACFLRKFMEIPGNFIMAGFGYTDYLTNTISAFVPTSKKRLYYIKTTHRILEKCQIDGICVLSETGGTCAGDSGGPLNYVADFERKVYVVGILSGGFTYKLENGVTMICGAGFEKFYSSSYYYAQTIENWAGDMC